MRFLMLFITLMFINSCSINASKDTGCDDYLKRFGADINAQYQHCEYFKTGQLDYYQALYKVKNRDFREVEAFLVEHYGMSELFWACYGYETRGWSEYNFRGNTYTVDMWSDELDLTKEDETKHFWVAIKQYTRIDI